MRKLVTLMIMLALFAMCFAPAVVAAPPGSNDGMAGTQGSDPDGGTNPPDPPPPIDPPDDDPWGSGHKIVPSGDIDNQDGQYYWYTIKVVFVKVLITLM